MIIDSPRRDEPIEVWESHLAELESIPDPDEVVLFYIADAREVISQKKAEAG